MKVMSPINYTYNAPWPSGHVIFIRLSYMSELKSNHRGGKESCCINLTRTLNLDPRDTQLWHPPPRAGRPQGSLGGGSRVIGRGTYAGPPTKHKSCIG